MRVPNSCYVLAIDLAALLMFPWKRFNSLYPAGGSVQIGYVVAVT